MTKDISFTVKNPKELLNYLNLLWKNNCLLAAYFGDRNESFITTIIKIDSKKKMLYLDYGPKEYLNKKLLDCQEVIFRTQYEGIKVELIGTKMTKCNLSGQAAFNFSIPKTIEWRERRQYYRVKSPLSNPAVCIIYYEAKDSENMISSQLNLYDISLSGMSMIYEEPELTENLSPLATYDNCKLILPGFGETNISFVVRNHYPLNPDKPKKAKKIGCEFTNVKPAFESILQRYMQTIEREHKKKS